MTTTLYLVRHGETVDNAAHIMQGQTPGELNDKGIAQAEEVAARMADHPIDVFVSSDLKRSIQTCEIIARPHHAEVITTPLLRERDWGSFTGKFIPSLPQDPKDWPDDIESIESMKSRAQNFITWLRVTYPGKTILCRRSWHHQQSPAECLLPPADERNRENGQCRSENPDIVVKNIKPKT